jgi:hypothetical protein
MSRRSLYLALLFLLLFASGALAAVCLLVRYEPRNYVQASLPPGEPRKKLANEFTQELTQLISIFDGGKDEMDWDARFTDEQINSYFSETFVHSGFEQRVLPDAISEPRIMFEPDRIRLAFRYGTGFWSTVVSLDLRVWLAEGEPNAIALQVVGFRAGAVPISAQKLFETVSELGRHNGLTIDWYRYEGLPVALLRFHNDLTRPTFELQDVHLEKGTVTIQGRCTDGAPVRAQLPANDPKPQAD